jgi:cytochrome c oxidase subunit II
MARRASNLCLFFAFLALSSLNSLAAEAGSKYWLPEQASSYAPDVDRLFYIVLYITLAVGIAVQLCLLWFVIRYRRRDGVASAHIKGSFKAEAVWTLIPAGVVCSLAFIQADTWKSIKGAPPAENALRVQLFAEQFQWNFRYAGNDGLWGTSDDVVLVNEMYVPVNTNVIVEASSKDVIHSFFVSHLRLKQDVLPGTQLQFWFNATKTTEDMRTTRPAVMKRVGEMDVEVPWDFEIVCAELCGAQHAQMRGYLYVLTAEAYAQKMKDLSETASTREPPAVWNRWPVADPKTGRRKP